METSTSQTTEIHSVVISATPEQVWAGITEPEFTTKYFFDSVIDSTFENGSAYAAWSADRSQQFADGEIIEARPSRVLSHTWRTLWDEAAAAEPASRVTWTIESQSDRTTTLTVIHDRLEDSPNTANSVAQGWGYVLEGLKALLETGQVPQPS